MHHNLDLDYDFKISWLVAWMFARVYSCTAVEQYCKFLFFFVLPCFPVMLHLWLLSPDPGSAGVFLVLKGSSSLILSLLTHSLTAGMFFSKIVGSYNAECREVAVVRNWHNVTKKKQDSLLSKLSLFYHLILSVVPLLKESIGILMQRTPFSLDHALPECYQRVSSDHTQCSKKR